MSSEIKQRKKISVGDNNDDQKPVSVVCHDFWKEAPEDLLLEIFIRLPDCQSAVISSSVCRLWHSIIIDNPQFIPRFMSLHHQHQDRYPPLSSYNIMFQYPERIFTGVLYHQPIFQLFSEEWMFLHGKLKSNFLDFLPFPMVIRASCNDLLLVSPPSLSSTDDFYVCNPITKQFVHLPPIPERMKPERWWDNISRIGYGLVCMSPCPTTTNVEFKVVEITSQSGSELLTLMVFCSESRNWKKINFHYPSFMITIMCHTLNVVTCNGILYWFGDDFGANIVYLDLLKEQCGVIEFPPFRSQPHEPKRIGVLCVFGGGHELRLTEAFRYPRISCAKLNVWRLNYNNDGDTNWVLVHEKVLTCPKKLSPKSPYICRPFLHPTNGNLMYVFWDQSCYLFNLVTETNKEIDGIMWENIHADYLPFPMVSSYGASCLTN